MKTYELFKKEVKANSNKFKIYAVEWDALKNLNHDEMMEMLKLHNKLMNKIDVEITNLSAKSFGGMVDIYNDMASQLRIMRRKHERVFHYLREGISESQNSTYCPKRFPVDMPI